MLTLVRYYPLLRVGEMERDAMISHGCSALILERLMLVSDKYRTVICRTCGNIAVCNYVATSDPTKQCECRVCGPRASFGVLTFPYVFKLIIHMLLAMGINTPLRTQSTRREDGRDEERTLV